MNITPRKYQAEGMGQIRGCFSRKLRAVVYVLPTGGGKTYTFSYIAFNAAARGRRVMILVHRKELLLQASKSLSNLGIKHGLISPHFTPAPHEMVQVASIDTLMQRLKKRHYHVDLLIVDEAHHVTDGNKWGKVYEMLDRPPMLGVTATPVRTDGIGLGKHAGGVFEEMVIGPSVPELIDMGFLVNPVVYASLDVPDLSGVKKTASGDYNRDELSLAVDKPKITGSAVEMYRKVCPGARAIVFCANIQHAKHVRDEFNAAGYHFALLVGAPEMSDAERTAVNKGLASGHYHGACTVDLVSEGYDLPALECCIMLRPTASEALFLQQVGRVMRPSEGKNQAVLLDHVGNVGAYTNGEFKRKHGLPSEEREWSLDGRKKRGRKAVDEEEGAKIKQCEKCYKVHPAAPSCPYCGYEYPVKVRSLEQVDGELQQITAEMAEQIRRDKLREQGQAQSVEALMALGHSEPAARRILQARAEKQEIISAITADLTAWQELTGQMPAPTFGVSYRDIRYMKPKALKELRQQIDHHKAMSLAAWLNAWKKRTGDVVFTNLGVEFENVLSASPEEVDRMIAEFKTHKAEYLAAKSSGEFQLEVA